MKYEPRKTENRNKYLEIEANYFHPNICNCTQKYRFNNELHDIKTKRNQWSFFFGQFRNN